jgi:hypothetical protein
MHDRIWIAEHAAERTPRGGTNGKTGELEARLVDVAHIVAPPPPLRQRRQVDAALALNRAHFVTHDPFKETEEQQDRSGRGFSADPVIRDFDGYVDDTVVIFSFRTRTRLFGESCQAVRLSA